MTIDWNYVFVNAKDFDAKELKNQSFDEVAKNLLTWFEIREAFPSHIDEELLDSVGMLLAEAHFDGLDKNVWAWYLSNPSSVRHEIVADFLCGFWRWTAKYDAPTVLANMNIVSSLDRSTWRYAATCFALYKLYVSKKETLPIEWRDRLKDLLKEHYELMSTENIHPGIASFLRRVKNE